MTRRDQVNCVQGVEPQACFRNEQEMDRLSEPEPSNGTASPQSGTRPAIEAGGAEASAPSSASTGTKGRGLNAVLGDITLLMSQSPAHKHLFLADLEWLLLPPLMLRQVRVFYAGKAPIAAALWASVSEEVEKHLEAGETRLRPQDWKSGDRLWLVELIAPGVSGNVEAVQALLTELAKTAFGGKPFKLRRGAQKVGKPEGAAAHSRRISAEAELVDK